MGYNNILILALKKVKEGSLGSRLNPWDFFLRKSWGVE